MPANPTAPNLIGRIQVSMDVQTHRAGTLGSTQAGSMKITLGSYITVWCRRRCTHRTREVLSVAPTRIVKFNASIEGCSGRYELAQAARP